MSVIQKIRDKYAALVIVLIALSLIAFILMDAFVGRGRGAGGAGSTVGKVNGEKINRTEFEQTISMQQAMYGGQEVQREQLVSSAWDMTVDEIVMQQEYEKLGLQFGAKELNDLLFGANPPQMLKQGFTDPQTGVYDVNKAKQYFAQVKKQKNNPELEFFIKSSIAQALRIKYMTLLGQSTYVPKWMAEKSMADQNAMASFSYVTVPYSSVPENAITVTDADVKNYIEDHKAEFKQDEETRSIVYASFDAFANAADTAAALNQIMRLKPEFEAATDVEGYLNRVSTEIPYVDNFVPGSKIQSPNADNIKQLGNGQTFGPFVEGKNYVVAKMIDRRSMPDSVKVRHILIKTGERGQTTLADTIAKARIDSIAGAIRNGADFKTMVLNYSDDPGSKSTGGEYEFTADQFGGLSKEFAEVAFYGNRGDKKVVKVENPAYSGYHYIEVLEQKKIEPAYKIAYLAKPIDASQETINTANNAAAQFAASSRNRKSFEDNLKKLGKQPMPASEIKQNDFSIPGLGNTRPLVRWVYESKPGSVSEPFEVGDHYVVALVTSVDEKGLVSASKAKPVVEQFIRNEKKAQQIIKSKFKDQKTLEAVAQTAGVSVQHADSASFAQSFVPNLGNEPKITGAAFNKNLQNKVSEPIAGNTGVFVIRGERISALPNAANSIEDQRNRMEMQLKTTGGYRSMEALKKAATIKDNRSDFY